MWEDPFVHYSLFILTILYAGFKKIVNLKERCGHIEKTIETLKAEKKDGPDKARLQERCTQTKSAIQSPDCETEGLEAVGGRCEHDASTTEALKQAKMAEGLANARLQKRCAQHERTMQSMDREIERLQALENHCDHYANTIEALNRVKMAASFARVRLQERCAQHEKTIQSLDQEIKNLKDELSESEQEWDRFQGRVEDEASSLLSGKASSWIHAKSASASDDSASWVSVHTEGSHCWMSEAVFKKVGELEDYYVKGCTLTEGSLVRGADDQSLLKVAGPPQRHEADQLVVLHAGGATLPLTAKHRVPVVIAGGKGEKQAKDLQKGDCVFVNGVPTELVEIETVPGKVEVLQIRFVPDEPVAVFMVPPSIDTKGHKRKPLRRSLKSRRGPRASDDDLKTEGYYTD